MTTQKDLFKLGLLISAIIHFSLFVFFPLWKTTYPKKIKITEVSLIVAEPESPPKKAPSPPPTKKKIEKKYVSKLSPVKIEVEPARSLPVLNPQVETESKIKIAFPPPEFKQVIAPQREEYSFERGKEVKKSVKGAPFRSELPPKIISPVQGKLPSFVSSAGSEKSGEASLAGKKAPPIKFKGLGTRKIERAVDPEYPLEMQKKGVEGSGKVKVYVAPSGEVLDVEIIQTSGWVAFDEEIRNTLYRWRFSPIEENVVKSYPGEFKFSLK